jgi:hypothetical protein
MTAHKVLARLAFLALVVVPTVGFAHASTVTIASVGTAMDPGQTNAVGATMAVNPDPNWAGPMPGTSWVSYTTSTPTYGSNFVVVPNGTVVDFSDTFTLNGIPTGGTVWVMADDTASVWLNGHMLVADAATSANTYATCSDFAIGCLVDTTLAINLPASMLVDGQNTLDFDVMQVAGSSYGLDYAGSINVAPTPEPSDLLLFGCGVLAAAGLLRKRLS